MTDEMKVAYVLSQIALFNAKVAGMVAENQQRAVSGQSPAYVELDFDVACERSGLNHNDVVGYFQS